MVIQTLKAITWGTIAAAVVSAVLMAFGDGATPRMAGLAGSPLRAAPAPSERPDAGTAPRRAERQRGAASH